MSDQPALVLREVAVARDSVPILRGITWQVPRGGRWIVLGANGSGKTSLLRILAGYAHPTRGTVEILGQQLGRTDVRQLRQGIGWVHADLASQIPRYMSVLDVVVSGLRGGMVVFDRPSPLETEGAEEALRKSGAQRLAERTFDSLSTGERQRVLIARALVQRPDLLLLDEPCVGLDPWARETFLSDLEFLYAGAPGLTVVYVTHGVEEITARYHGLLVLRAGEVLAQGPLAQTLDQSLVSRAYGGACRLHAASGRYSLHFHTQPQAVALPG